jgi:5-methylcytosine-specific restriction endonuclease McrA
MQKRYRADNASKVSAGERAWRERNKERKRANDISWQQRYPDKVKLFRRVSEHRRRAAKVTSPNSHTAADVEKLYRLQKGTCTCCGANLADGFHVDHVKPLKLGGHNGRTNIQLLCPTCNMRKSSKDPIQFMRENGFLL